MYWLFFQLFTKIKQWSGSTFLDTFSAYIFHENFPCIILYQLIRFQYQTFFTSLGIKLFVFLNSVQTNDNITNFIIYLQSASPVISGMAYKGNKMGKREVKKIEHLENERSLFCKIKKVCHSFSIFFFFMKYQACNQLMELGKKSP